MEDPAETPGREPRHEDDTTDVEEVEAGEKEAGSRAEEVERAAEREDEAPEG